MDFEKAILIPMQEDGLDLYRKEYNNMPVSYTHLDVYKRQTFRNALKPSRYATNLPTKSARQ